MIKSQKLPLNKSFKISLIIVFCLLLFPKTQAQELPNGVVKIGAPLFNPNFIFSDSKNNIWSSSAAGGYNNYGLHKMSGGNWSVLNKNTIFTDAVEDVSNVYFSAKNGIYTYDGSTLEVDNSVTNNSCVAIFNNDLYAGSIGQGLYKRLNDKYSQVPIVVNGMHYDSIYCLKADGNLLWIGTSNGLIRFDGTNFTHFNLPLVAQSSSLANSNQRTILSIQKDKNNRIWALTKNQVDSIDCLFFLENNKFISAREKYNSSCFFRDLIPYKANKINVNNQGNVILGMAWGFMEFDERIKPIVIGTLLGYGMNNNYNTLVLMDNSDKVLINLVAGQEFSGFYSIDPKLYSLQSMEEIQNAGRLNFNTLDINEIKATTANDGTMFNTMDAIERFLDKPTYDIPSLGCGKPMYSSALWVGGYDETNNNLHVAAQTYRQTGSDYYPGPIDLVTKQYDSAANSYYNKIWKVDRKTIEIFKLNYNKPFYTIPDEILNWPAHGKGNFTQNLAPFVDVDKNGIYEPINGDYPKIKGDQMLWWVFNDMGVHSETNGNSMGLEIHGSCYAYYHNSLSTEDTNALVNRSIFFNYKFINRSNSNYKEFYTGLFNDVDLGNYSDDLVGCDTLQNVGFGYNGKNIDEGPKGFGKNPPMILCKFLNQKMTNFISYNNDFSDIGNPNTPEHFYNYLRSTFKNDSMIHFINQGYPCNNPYNDIHNRPSDKRFLMSTNTPLLQKDSAFELEFAYILLHNPEIDFLKEGCDEPSKNLQRIQNWYDHSSFPSKPYTDLSAKQKVSSANTIKIFPNPTLSKFTITGGIAQQSIHSIQLLDYSGKVLLNLDVSDNVGSLNTDIDLSGMASGLYFVRLLTDKEVFIFREVKY